MNLNLIGFISHIPQSLPPALGAAMSFRYRKLPQAALTVCGDGGSTAGVFHECLNMASLYQAPLVIILENNQYAYSTPVHAHTAVPDLVDKARSYAIPAVVVDGNDVASVYDATCRMLDQARQGGGPGLIEARTMRMLGHAIHDGADYVPAALLAEWEARDPVRALRERLLGQATVDTEQLAALEVAVDTEILEAFEEAEQSPLPNPATVQDGIYAD